MTHRLPRLLLCCCLPVLLTGCSVNVQKGENGEDKRVHIDTPLADLRVNTDKAPQNIGIGVYPGAAPSSNHDGDKNADVKVGFGDWQVRVQVAHYTAPDAEAKLITWYRRELGSHGDVIECRGNQPVGTLTRTSDGLACEENDYAGTIQLHGHEEDRLTLRAGSRHRQYIVAFDKDAPDAAAGPTKFTLIGLELPTERWKKDRQPD